jgi:hypothetical protein
VRNDNPGGKAFRLSAFPMLLFAQEKAFLGVPAGEAPDKVAAADSIAGMARGAVPSEASRWVLPRVEAV